MTKENDIFDCEITDISFGGDGVARLPDGAVVFVPYTAIGDQVRIVLTQRGKSFCRGSIVKLLTPGTGRAEPLCDRYGECGGCCYQHLTYEAEIAAKKVQFLAAMRRIGHFQVFPELEAFHAAPERYGYRNKLRLEAYRKTGSHEVHYGFFENDNQTCFPVKKCLLAQEPLNQAISKAKQDSHALQNARNKVPAPLTLRIDSTGRTAFYFDYASPKMPWMREKLMDFQVAVPVGSFWQVNPPVATKLLQTVKAWLAPLQLRSLIDAYGGIGTFSLAMEDLFQYRVIIESDKQAIACSEYNHKERGLKAHFITGTTEGALSKVLTQVDLKETCVILDPPRTGCLPKAIQTLLEFPVHTLLYVSCNPTTLARDLKVLSSHYIPTRAACFDMFPATAHFESAVLLHHI